MRLLQDQVTDGQDGEGLGPVQVGARVLRPALERPRPQPPLQQLGAFYHVPAHTRAHAHPRDRVVRARSAPLTVVPLPARQTGHQPVGHRSPTIVLCQFTTGPQLVRQLIDYVFLICLPICLPTSLGKLIACGEPVFRVLIASRSQTGCSLSTYRKCLGQLPVAPQFGRATGLQSVLLIALSVLIWLLTG